MGGREIMGSKAQWIAAFVSVLISMVCMAAPSGQDTPEQQARKILRTCDVTGGLIVHLGCGDGKLTAALRASDACLVHGLDADVADVERAREHLQSLGLYGAVAVEQLTVARLPYIDNLVNLVVSEDLGRVSMDEVMRVLCPNGVAYIKKGSDWTKTQGDLLCFGSTPSLARQGL
jgi:SAM-dependent methyltransferase